MKFRLRGALKCRATDKIPLADPEDWAWNGSAGSVRTEDSILSEDRLGSPMGTNRRRPADFGAFF
jgi:hypothetical protein